MILFDVNERRSAAELADQVTPGFSVAANLNRNVRLEFALHVFRLRTFGFDEAESVETPGFGLYVKLEAHSRQQGLDRLKRPSLARSLNLVSLRIVFTWVRPNEKNPIADAIATDKLRWAT